MFALVYSTVPGAETLSTCRRQLFQGVAGITGLRWLAVWHGPGTPDLNMPC
jgi:hypothetical protein